MATLEQLRSLFPDAGSDSDVIKAAAKDFGLDPMQVASDIGVKINAPGLMTSVKRGAGQVASAFGSTAQDLGLESAGKAVEGYGADVAFRNPAAVNTLSEAVSNPWQTVKETIGELGPQIGASVLTGGLGRAIGSVGGRVVGGIMGLPLGPGGVIGGQAAGAALGAGAGAYVGNLIQEYGGIRSEQREAGIEDKTRALGSASAAAALDTAFGAERLVNKVGNRGLDILSREAGSKLLPHVAKQTGLGLATESGTEFLQTGLERFGAYKDLTSDEAINEYGMSALKGGLGGGMIRGGLSSIAGQQSILPGSTQPTGTPGAPAPANDIQQVFQDTSTGTTPVASMPAAATITPSDTLGGVPETPAAPAVVGGVPPAPAVVGGTTDIAQAQVQAQAAQQQQEAQQQQQAAREEFTQRFGSVRPALDENGQPTQSVVFQNKTYHTRDELDTAVDKLIAKDQTKDSHVREVQSAFTKTFSTPEKTPSISSVVSQTSRYTNSTASVEEAASRINTEISTLVGQGKKLDDTKLSKLAEFYENLTGATAPAYIAAEQVQPKGAKNGKLQLQGDAGLREVPVQGGAGEAGTVGAGNVQPGGIQPIGAGGLAAGPSDQQTGLVSGEGVRAGTSSTDTGNVDRLGLNVGQGQGQGPVNVSGEPTQVTQGLGDGGQVSSQADQVPGVSVPAADEGVTGEVRTAPVSELVKDADIISNLYAQVLTPTQQKATGMTLEQRVEMVRLALTEQATEEEIAQLTGASTTTIDGQLRRLGIVVRPQFTESQLAERVAIAARLGISPEALEEAHDVKSDARAKYLSDSITAEVTPEDRARSVSRLVATFAGQNAQYTVVTPKAEMQKGKLKQYERLDVLFQRAADAFRSAEFPQGIPRRDLLEMLTPKRVSSEGKQTVDEEMRQQIEQGEEQTFDKTVALSDELYGTDEAGETRSMGTIATAGGSQGEVESVKKAALDKVEAAQRELAKLAPQDPRRAAAQAKLEAAWVDYSGIKPPVVAEAPKAEVTDEVKAVKTKFKNAKGDLTKFNIGELQILLDEANKFNNRELAKKLDIEMASRTTTAEVPSAIQKPSPASVPVSEPARGGQEVGKGDTEGGQAATEGKAKAKEVKTSFEVTIDGAPATVDIFRAVGGEVRAGNTEITNVRIIRSDLPLPQTFGGQGYMSDEQMLSNLVETEIIDTVVGPAAATEGKAKTEEKVTRAPAKATAKTVLDTSKYVFHAVRSDDDLGEIMRSGVAVGTNVSTTHDGQAFAGEGDTILVLPKQAAQVVAKQYQDDSTVGKTVMPIAILKDTSLAPTETQDSAMERLSEEANKITEQLEAFDSSLGITAKQRMALLMGERAKAKEALGEFYDRIVQLDKLQDRIYAQMDRAESLPATVPTAAELLSPYTGYGVPVFTVAINSDDAGKTTVRVTEASPVAKTVRKKPVKAEVTQENVEIKTPEEQWTALAEQFPSMPPYAALDRDEQARWDDLANRGVANLAAANKLMGEKPAPVTPVAEDEQRFEREMRSLATAEKPEGEYVQTTALRYVPLKAALDIARRAAATVPLNWVQFHSQLDLTNDSAVYLVQLLQDEGVVSAPMPSIESMFEPTPTRLASKSRSFNDIFELSDELPGADIATDQLAELGIEHALDYVSDWETINDTSPNAINGEIVSRGGRYAVILNEAQLTNSDHATETVTHEVGHAVDMAPHGGIYSSQPEMSVIVKDGKVTPVGAVAKELHNLYQTDKNWSEYLEYPFDTSLFTEMDNHVIVEGELFAQLFSAYVNPKTRAAIEKIAPVSAAYMAEVVKHVQSTKALQLQTAPVAAQRTLAFKNRNASGGSQAGVNPTQGRQRERFASRSRAQAIEEGINGLPKQWQKSARTVTSDIPNALKKGSLAAAITEDVIALASKYMKSASKYLEAQFARYDEVRRHEQKIDRILQQFERLPQALQGIGEGSVNKFIADSTINGKWAYYPGAERIGRGEGNKREFVYDINGKKRLVAPSVFEVDEGLEARFKAMPPEAQKMIRDVFDHGFDTLVEKQEAVRDAINAEYQKRIDAAMGDTEMEDKYKQERDAKIAAEYRLLQLDGTKPYAYLGRHGDYVVVAKSAEFTHWEEQVESKDISTQEQERAVGWMAENRSNPEHYVVQFAETLGEADQIAADLNATGKYDQAEASEKEAFRNEGGDALAALGRLRSRFESDFADADENSKKSVDTMIGDLYLQLVSEASSRKSLMQRQKTAGFDGNMMRNLATRGRSDAHFLATVRHNESITEAISAMREERKRNPRAASPLFNELLTRHMNSLDYSAPNLLVDFMTKASSVYFLATSPAFYLQQILQTGVISLPYMSGRLGYFRSARAISKAYGDMAALVKGLGVSDHVDFANAPADVRDMLQKLVGMGKIDVGIDSDARVRAGDQGVVAKVLGKLQAVNNRIETVNRATAAIAAYRGYLDRYKNNDTVAATKYAAEVVSNTHGSYDAFNTPRVLNSGAGKVLLQFKRFQIIQLSMLGKLIYTSFKGASKDEKAVARRALGFITGQMAILGGMVGVPFAQQAASILSGIFGDEDEPDDWEYKLRRAVGDPVLADLLVNGVPGVMGVNIGSRVGLGNVTSLLPFTDVGLTSRSGMEKVLVGLMGPTAGLALKFADGAGLISKGDYYKGVEQLLPNGVTNALRGARFATEGVTMRNGDVVLKPEEITMVDAAFQAVGLPTTTITDRQRTQRTVAEFDKYFQDRAGEIKKDYIEARRAGDNTSDAMTEWTKLQEARVRNGYKRQPMSDLLRAPMAATKRERDVTAGIEFNKGNRQFVQSLAEQ